MIDLPKLVLSKKSTATAYHFDVTTPRRCGWALCTVNDNTGELQIMSDWGNWAHRWHASPSSLGLPTLTHFIGQRDKYASHYLAGKLCKRDESQTFSAELTVRELGRQLAESRRDGDVDRSEHIATAKVLADMRHIDDVRDFVDAWNRSDAAGKVNCEPWESFRHEPTGSYLVLRDAILPALIEACRVEANLRDELARAHAAIREAVAP